MYKDVLRSIDGVSIFPIITLVLFLGFFLAMLFYLHKKGKSHYDEVANLPLEPDEPTETNDEKSL